MCDTGVISVRIRPCERPKAQANHDSRRVKPGYLQENRGNGLVMGSMTPVAVNAAIEDVKTAYAARNGRKMPSNAKPMVAGVITFGTSREKGPGEGLNDEERQRINRMNKEAMDAAAKRYMEWLEVYHGCKVTYCVRHDDESTRHYHFMATNVNHKGKSLTKHMSRADFADLQDYASVCFPDFERGRNKKVRSCDYKSVSEGHVMHLQHLSQETQKLMKRAEVYENRYRNRLEQLGGTMEELEGKADDLSRLSKDAERQAVALSKTLEYLGEELKPQVVKTIEEARERAKEAKELESRIRKPTRTPDELQQARDKVREMIREQMESPSISGPGGT